MLSRTVECRAAIRAGNFTAADRLLGELRAEVEAAWPQAGLDQRETLAEEVLDLLKWARKAALVQRSHAHTHLLQLVRSSAYVAPASEPDQRVEFDG